jgi:hypothetical protein
MGVTQIASPVAGEDLIGIEPELLQQVDPGWRRRLSLFTGRALSDTALDGEQLYRSGRLAMLGQAVTPGTVQGLELAVDVTAADPVLTVNMGYGILANGEDVTLLSTLRTTLSTLPVIDETGTVVSLFKDFAGANAAGILVLQPIVAQLNGQSLDTAPTSMLVSGNLEASCDADPSEYAFQDLEIVDGCRIGFLPWPTETLTLPDPSVGASTWRNRIAYAIYAAEIALPADTSFPWELVGLPLAVAGFDASSKLLFADRYSVVRQGGLPRSRYVLPTNVGLAQPIQLVQPALAQARIAQLAEQIVQTPGITALGNVMTLLPPAGILPAAAVNFPGQSIPWFPTNWTVTAGPIHLEELESALESGMTSEPLDVTQEEVVELLVPLPDAVYDPDVLVVETIDAAFQAALDAATAARNITLQHAKAVGLAANALLAATGATPTDLNAGLTEDEIAARDGAAVYTPVDADAYGTTVGSPSYTSNDLQKIITTAAAAPYTVTPPNHDPIPLFNPDDITDLTTNGVPHFIDRINAKLDRADDLINLAFVTAQTDIYRFRQNVLSTTNATRLVTSPVLANIASGDSADATAQNISTYLQNLVGQQAAYNFTENVQTASTTAGGSTTSGAANSYAAMRTATAAAKNNVVTNRTMSALFTAKTQDPLTQLIDVGRYTGTVAATASSPTVNLGATKATTGAFAEAGLLGGLFGGATGAGKATATDTSGTIAGQGSSGLSATDLAAINSQLRLTPTDSAQDLNATAIAGTGDVTGQQPIIGAQLNLRTLSIGERLKQPVSQESLFYGIGNRLNIMELLSDLEITTDDLQFIVDSPPQYDSTGAVIQESGPIRVEAHSFYELRDIKAKTTLYQIISSPHLDDNSDEAGVFSTGVRLLDQHTQLLRAVEARIQQYRDFINQVATPALTSAQRFLAQAQSAYTGLQNDLNQERQNLAFTNALLLDEEARIASVNAQRMATLATYVQVIAFARPRTLDLDADVPSRQLVPGNITSPVPACLGQTVTVPPELREIASLVREAPLSWFPSASGLLIKIQQPSLLSELATAVQARASFQLQQPVQTSSATSSSGVYAPAIANLFKTNQQVFRTLQMQRTSLPVAQVSTLSWNAQVQALKPVAALADLVSTSIVHAEVSNATARLVQQISSVATCLYTRVGLTLPVERLQWAEYLSGDGLSAQLTSLAILPGWNAQAYVSRQQMQLLVDWLFQQVDQTIAAAMIYMSDVVRTCILLASHAPVDSVIAGAVTGRLLPVLGGYVTLSSASTRVTQGMNVQFFQAGQMVAQGTVSDLDAVSVKAQVTKVYQPGVFLEDQSVAHFTAQPATFAALKAFAQ